MTVEDLADLMELHAKRNMAGELGDFLKGKTPHIKGDVMRPWFVDRDIYESDEAYQEALERAEEHNAGLAENPSAMVQVTFMGWFPNHPTGGHVATNYSMSLSEAEEYGKDLNDVLSMRLMDALEDLQNLQPAGA
jgi:hypothetical protein